MVDLAKDNYSSLEVWTAFFYGFNDDVLNTKEDYMYLKDKFVIGSNLFVNCKFRKNLKLILKVPMLAQSDLNCDINTVRDPLEQVQRNPYHRKPYTTDQ